MKRPVFEDFKIELIGFVFSNSIYGFSGFIKSIFIT